MDFQPGWGDASTVGIHAFRPGVTITKAVQEAELQKTRAERRGCGAVPATWVSTSPNRLSDRRGSRRSTVQAGRTMSCQGRVKRGCAERMKASGCKPAAAIECHSTSGMSHQVAMHGTSCDLPRRWNVAGGARGNSVSDSLRATQERVDGIRSAMRTTMGRLHEMGGCPLASYVKRTREPAPEP